MATQHFCGYLKERNKERKVRIAYDRPNKVVINGVQTRFSKFFSEHDKQSTLWALRHAERVVFIDTPPTKVLVETIEALQGKGVEVYVRDHHDVSGEPRTDRDREIRKSANRIRTLLGENAVVSNRSTNPACSSLIREGEFNRKGTVIVADADLDGLTAAMKASGTIFSTLDHDAAVLDGPLSGQSKDTLSPNVYLLTQAMGALPQFDPNNPEIAEEAKTQLFSDFVALCGGDTEARERLEKAVSVYASRVQEAWRLVEDTREVHTGIFLVDTRKSKGWDGATFAKAIENKLEAKVTVLVKASGAIASRHNGVQYQLVVSRAFQDKINLQQCLPEKYVSSPESGIISNTTFILNVSEGVYISEVFPRLKMLLSETNESGKHVEHQMDAFRALRIENLKRLKESYSSTIKNNTLNSTANIVSPKKGDERMVERARRARAERERRATQKKRFTDKSTKKVFKPTAVRSGGQFSRPKQIASTMGERKPTNIGNPVPKGPTGNKQKHTTNPKKLAKIKRKLAQRNK